MVPRKGINPEIKEQYLDWLKVPPGLREPRTKKDIAEQLGVTHRTLLNWEQSDEFKAELLKFRKGLAANMYADLIGAAYEIAMEGPVQQRVSAIKLLLDHMEFQDEDKEKKNVLPEETAAAIEEILKAKGFQVIGRDN